MRKIAAASGLLFLLLAIAGLTACGNEAASTTAEEEVFTVRADTTITTANPPISEATFTAQTNDFCRRAWPSIRRDLAEQKRSQNRELSHLRRFEETVRLSLLPQVKLRIFDELRSLGAPEGEALKIERLSSALEEAIEIGQREFRIENPATLWDLFDIFNPMARRYGLDECLVNRAHTQIQ